MYEDDSLFKLHEQFINGTKEKEYVKVFTHLLCPISKEVKKAVGAKYVKVYITSKVLKHIYDLHFYVKHQMDIYVFIIKNLHLIVKDPDMVRKNIDSQKKRAQIVFFRVIDGENYVCPLEIEQFRKGKKIKERLCVVTAFKERRGGNYLSGTDIYYQK
jgi:hypothetical protein